MSVAHASRILRFNPDETKRKSWLAPLPVTVVWRMLTPSRLTMHASRLSRLVPLATLFFLILASGFFAQGPSYDKEIADLEKKIRELNKKLAELREKQNNKAATGAIPDDWIKTLK